ncbi:MAG TPA: hypothetical protein VD993_03775 [Chitinophagaceae bacterium]|nr:hypothetical protein [Chitinophagaceae bacterium]
MKKTFLLVIVLVTAVAAFTQPKPKPKEKPPTQKEIAEMMKEMQAAMDELSPEDKKMMDSMGIKMPDVKTIQKNISGISDAQLKKAFEDEYRVVPLKDRERIASISKAPVTPATLTAYLQAAYERLNAQLKPREFGGDQVYAAVKEKYQTPTAVGNAAVGCWMMGKPRLALYLANRACKDDPADADNLNNFAAFLTMGGAEELAIPLLNHLNKQFPQNSTILNNLGQAWFGLGDVDKAGKYLDSTIRIYAYHPQANLTKSLIDESKGNMQAAIEAVKRSIAEAYSIEKENRLSKMNYKLKTEDITWNKPMPQDPLGLEKFNWPAYPVTVAESELLEAEWKAFKKKCSDDIAELEQQKNALEQQVTKAKELLAKQLMEAGPKGLVIDPMPRFAYKAMAKLGYMVNDKDGHMAYAYQEKLEALADANIQAARFDETLLARLRELEKIYEDQFGEGKANPFGAACADDTRAKDNYLNAANSVLRETFNDFIGFMRRKINDEAYYYQYTMWPEEFELAKLNAKLMWLNLISSQNVKFKNKSPWCNSGNKAEGKPFKLSKFDDLHCRYKDTLYIPLGMITSSCSKLTGKLDLDFVKLGMTTKQGDRDDESFMDQFQNCSIEIGIKKKASIGEGPLKAEAKVGVSAFVEIDKTGITDAGVKAVADLQVGTNVVRENGVKIEPVKDMSTLGPSAGDQSVTIIGTEAKISVLSGFTVSGRGVLKGMKK